MAFRWLLTINIIALVFLGLSFLLAILLKRLMGKGKDTGPVKLLIIVIILNGMLGLLLLAGSWFEYLSDWVSYAVLTDVTLMIIGMIMTGAVWWVYNDYKKLIKKHEPGA